MNSLTALAEWIAEHPETATLALKAAGELITASALPYPAAGTTPALPQFTGIPAADRAVADAAGIGAIAGRWCVSETEILEVIGLIKNVVLTLL